MKTTTAQMALDALKKSQVFAECTKWDETYKAHHAAIAALEAEIAQPVEPVAQYASHFSTPEGTKEFRGYAEKPLPPGTMLYAAPQEPAAPGWLPISQAPKYGTLVDIWEAWGEGERHIDMLRMESPNGDVYYTYAGKRTGAGRVRLVTHFMPRQEKPGEPT